MTNFLQMHILTAYPASNLNRDDTGRPKTVDFGGVQRLRISSQSLKRAWRASSVFEDKLKGHLGKRTLRLGELVAEHLVAKGMSEEKAVEAARSIASQFGKLAVEKVEKKNAKKSLNDGAESNTDTLDEDAAKRLHIKQLAFISPDEQRRALEVADRLFAGEELKISAADIMNKVDSAADIAMFGRMLADNAAFNRDAAVQVAHAMTTHGVAIEDDYYVAVDDLKKSSEDAGSSFIGSLEYGAGLFYQYVCINCDLLRTNLDGDTETAQAAIGALIEAATTVSPGGKQNSFASRARASYVLLERGTQQPRSLANAFLRAVSDRNTDVLAQSVKQLQDLRSNMDKVYGACSEKSALMLVSAEMQEGTLTDLIKFGEDCVE